MTVAASASSGARDPVTRGTRDGWNNWLKWDLEHHFGSKKGQVSGEPSKGHTPAPPKAKLPLPRVAKVFGKDRTAEYMGRDLHSEGVWQGDPAKSRYGTIAFDKQGRILLREPKGHFSGMCVPLDSEILTRSGWKRHDEVQAGDETIGFDLLTQTSRWTKVTAVHHYDDAPIVLYGAPKLVQLRCTPNHRWLTTTRNYGVTESWDMAEATQKLRRGAYRVQKAVFAAAHKDDGSLDITPDEAALLAWIVTDGSMTKAKRGVVDSWEVAITQMKEVGRSAIEELLDRMDFPHRRQIDYGGKATYRLQAHGWRRLFARTGYAGDKAVLPDIVLGLSSDAVAAFMDAAYLAEGDTTKGKRGIYQNPGPCLDAMAVGAYRLGWLTAIRDGQGRNKRLSMMNAQVRDITYEPTDDREPVWCVTTELGTWTMRQGRHIVLTGNSWTFAKGHPDPDEHPVETARRETLEETGLNPAIVGHLRGTYGGSTGLDHYYLAHVDDSQHPEFLNGETDRLTWAKPDEAEQLLKMSPNNTARERDLWALHDAVAEHARLYPKVSTPMEPRTTLTVEPTVAFPKVVHPPHGVGQPIPPVPRQATVVPSARSVDNSTRRIAASVASGTRDWYAWDLAHPATGVGHASAAHAWGEAGAAAWQAAHPFGSRVGSWSDEDRSVVARARDKASKLPAGRRFAEKRKMTEPEFKAHRAHVEHELVAHGSTDLMRSPFSTHNSEDRLGGVNGVYHPDRTAAHRQIIDEIMHNAAEVPNEHRALVTAGLGGAGKSTILRRGAASEESVAHKMGIRYGSYDEHGNGVGEPSNYLTLNPDDIKERMVTRGMIPEIDELSPMERSSFVHEEASHITHQIAQRALVEGKNHIWDITLNSVRSGDVRVAPLHQHGYRVGGVMVDVSPEHSLQNAYSRHLHGQERFNLGQGHGGRYVPSDLILGAKDDSGQYRSKNRAAFEDMKARGAFDKTVTVDNEGNAGRIIDESGTRAARGDGRVPDHPIRAQIDRYAAGELPWGDLLDFLATYDYATPSHYRPDATEADLDDADRDEPATFGEVNSAHAQGKLSDAEYDQVVRAISPELPDGPDPVLDSGSRADPAMFSANGKLNGWWKWDQDHPYQDMGYSHEAGKAWGKAWGEGAAEHAASHAAKTQLDKGALHPEAANSYKAGHNVGLSAGLKLAGDSPGASPLDSKQISDKAAPLYAAAKKAKDQGNLHEHAKLLGAAHGFKEASNAKGLWEKANNVKPHADVLGGKGKKVGAVAASVAGVEHNATEAPTHPLEGQTVHVFHGSKYLGEYSNAHLEPVPHGWLVHGGGAAVAAGHDEIYPSKAAGLAAGHTKAKPQPKEPQPLYGDYAQLAALHGISASGSGKPNPPAPSTTETASKAASDLEEGDVVSGTHTGGTHHYAVSKVISEGSGGSLTSVYGKGADGGETFLGSYEKGRGVAYHGKQEGAPSPAAPKTLEEHLAKANSQGFDYNAVFDEAKANGLEQTYSTAESNRALHQGAVENMLAAGPGGSSKQVAEYDARAKGYAAALREHPAKPAVMPSVVKPSVVMATTPGVATKLAKDVVAGDVISGPSKHGVLAPKSVVGAVEHNDKGDTVLTLKQADESMSQHPMQFAFNPEQPLEHHGQQPTVPRETYVPETYVPANPYPEGSSKHAAFGRAHDEALAHARAVSMSPVLATKNAQDYKALAKTTPEGVTKATGLGAAAGYHHHAANVTAKVEASVAQPSTPQPSKGASGLSDALKPEMLKVGDILPSGHKITAISEGGSAGNKMIDVSGGPHNGPTYTISAEPTDSVNDLVDKYEAKVAPGAPSKQTEPIKAKDLKAGDKFLFGSKVHTVTWNSGGATETTDEDGENHTFGGGPDDNPDAEFQKIPDAGRESVNGLNEPKTFVHKVTGNTITVHPDGSATGKAQGPDDPKGTWTTSNIQSYLTEAGWKPAEPEPSSEHDLGLLTKKAPGETFANGETVPGTGSGGGQWYEDHNGRGYFLKGYRSDAHSMNEVAGSLAYRQAGVPTQKVTLVKMDNGQLRALSHYRPGLEPIKASDVTPHTQAQARRGFGMDALMSHYDVFGLPSDPNGRNLYWNKAGNGAVVRLDLGGTGRFRAQGTPKSPSEWSPGDWTAPGANPAYKTLRESEQGKLTYGAESGKHQDEIDQSLAKAAEFDTAKYHQAMLEAGISKDFADSQTAVVEARRQHLYAEVVPEDAYPRETAPVTASVASSVAATPASSKAPPSPPRFDPAHQVKFKQAVQTNYELVKKHLAAGTKTPEEIQSAIDKTKALTPVPHQQWQGVAYGGELALHEHLTGQDMAPIVKAIQKTDYAPPEAEGLVPISPHVTQTTYVPAHTLHPGDVAMGKMSGGKWQSSKYYGSSKWKVVRVSDATTAEDIYKKVRVHLIPLDANEHEAGDKVIAAVGANTGTYRLKHKGAGEKSWTGGHHNVLMASEPWPAGTGVGAAPPLPTVAASSTAGGPKKTLTSVMAKNLKVGDKFLWQGQVHQVTSPYVGNGLGAKNLKTDTGLFVGGATLSPSDKLQKLTPLHPQFAESAPTVPAAPTAPAAVIPSVASAIPTVSASEALQPSTTSQSKFFAAPTSHKAEYKQAFETARAIDGSVVTHDMIDEAHKAFQVAPAGSIEESQLKGVTDGLTQAAFDWGKANASLAQAKKDQEYITQVAKHYEGNAPFVVDTSASASVPSTIPHGTKPPHATAQSSTAYDLAIAQGYDQATAAYKGGTATPEQIQATVAKYLDQSQAIGTPTDDKELIDQAHLAGLAQGAGKAAVDLAAGHDDTFPNASSKSVIQQFKPTPESGTGSPYSGGGGQHVSKQSDVQLSLGHNFATAISKWKGEYYYSSPGPVGLAMKAINHGQNPTGDGAAKAWEIINAYVNKAQPSKFAFQRKVTTHGTSAWAQKFLTVDNEVDIPLTSWSTNPEKWSGNMWLHVPPGTVTLDIAKVAGLTHEAETITGGHFKVTEIKKQGGTTHVYLEQLAPYAPSKEAYSSAPPAKFDVEGKVMTQAQLDEWLNTLVTDHGTTSAA